MTIRSTLAFFCAVTLVAACAAPGGPGSGGATVNKAPLPADLTITPPSADVPAEYAVFSGLWQGVWGSALDGKLAVTEVMADGSVKAIYAWGPSRGRFEAGNSQREGAIVDAATSRKGVGNGGVAAYVAENGALKGKYVRNGNVSRGTFRRVE